MAGLPTITLSHIVVDARGAAGTDGLELEAPAGRGRMPYLSLCLVPNARRGTLVSEEWELPCGNEHALAGAHMTVPWGRSGGAWDDRKAWASSIKL